MPPFKEIVYVEPGGRAGPEDDEARRQLPDRGDTVEVSPESGLVV
jgi:hypothetical protein